MATSNLDRRVLDIQRDTRRLRFRSRAVALAGVAATFVLALGPSAVVAANTLTVSTPYPAVTVAPGSKVSFTLTVKASEHRQVHLAVSGVPTGWTATFHGGGFVVDAVTADPSGTPPDVRLDINVAAQATGGTSNMTVTASSGGLSQQLPVSVTVSAKAAGSVALTTDFPSLQGPATGTFPFSLTLANNTDQDLTFALVATGPDAGWTVTATPSGQTQASSAVVTAGSTSTISVSAQPPSDIAAGDYEVDVSATSGSNVAQAKLGVTITGSYKLNLTTPDGALNAHGNAGSQIGRTLTIQNTGSAPVTNVKLSTTTIPTGWSVKYDPSDTVQSIAANGSATVTAQITPANDAVAGDYIVTFNAAGSGAGATSSTPASATADIRVTIDTSLLGGVLGLILIVIVVAGLGWVFRTYGRR